MKFYGREEELNELRMLSNAANKKAVICVITGIRRIGKTELIKEFFKKENGIYFFVDNSRPAYQLLAEFSSELKQKLGLSDRLVTSSWDDFFKDLFEAAEQKKIVVAFDEFQRFASVDKSVPFVLQKHFDLKKNDSRLLILLSGSSFGLLKQMFVGQDAPLFQRPSNTLNLRQFDFRTVCQVLGDLGVTDFIDKIELYALFGGIPKYYDLIEDYGVKSSDEAMKKLVFSKQAPLRGEVKNILIEEFGKETVTYYSILSAVALGKTKANEIADYAGIKETSMAPYLFDLTELLGALKKELPVTESIKSKKARYYLDNNFFKLWFKFVYRNRSEFELERFDELFKSFKAEKHAFIGHSFENVCKQYLVKAVPFDTIGKWWGKGKNETIEIDLVALDEKNSIATFAECKWQKEQPTIADLERLREKVGFVSWKNGVRAERFVYFSKIGFSKKTADYGRTHGWLLVSLKELEKAIESPV